MMKQDRWTAFYQPPISPLARLGMVLLGIGTLALSFVLGLAVLAVAMGLAVIGAIALAVRRLLAGRRVPNDASGPIEVEYRVIHRERRKSPEDPPT